MKAFIKTNRFTLALFLLIIIAFIILQPTSASTLNSNNRQTSWDTFVQSVDGQRMDTKHFWQTREFYSPGNFIYKKEGLDSKKQKELLQGVGLLDPAIDSQVIVLQYTAADFISFESLVPDAQAPVIQKSIQNLSNKSNVVAKGKNFVILKTKPTKAVIVFLATLDEMKKTNGFFKYEEDDKEFVRGKTWLSVSEVTVDK